MTATYTSARLRRYLTAGYTLLILYASLLPFIGWHEQGLAFSEVLTAPLRQTYSWLDLIINLAAYLPFGALLALTLRARVSAVWSILLATLGGLMLSTTMEYAQLYLPGRVSSNVDILANTAGTLLGALLELALVPQTLLAALVRLRQHFFRNGAVVDFGVALVALWMFAQINPSLPMLGNVFISEAHNSPFVPIPPATFSWLACVAVALNLLMVGCLLLTLLHARRHAIVGLVLILCAVALIKFIAAAILLNSWALLLWLNVGAVVGTAAGLLLVAAISWLPHRLFRWHAAATAGGYIALTQGLMESGRPSSARPLLHWHYGHLLNYNGLSRTILLLFPLLLLAYLWRTRDR